MKLIRNIIIIKFILLAVAVLYLKGYIKWQERPLVALQETKKEDEEQFVEEKEEKPKKKTYLDELFELPKFDESQLKKDEIGRYLSLVQRKTTELKEYIHQAQIEKQSMEELVKVIDHKLKQLDNERQLFNESLQHERKIQQERLDDLVEFYKKMSPKKAAPVFEKMNKDLVIALFKRLPKKQIMNILEAASPEKSVELSEYYGRIRSGKEYEVIQEINNSLREEFNKRCINTQTASK